MKEGKRGVAKRWEKISMGQRGRRRKGGKARGSKKREGVFQEAQP